MPARDSLTTEIKTAPADVFPPVTWTTDDTLEPIALTRKLLPAISTLTLKRHYGHVNGAVRTAQSYAGQFVQITVTDPNTDPAETQTWWGYISPSPQDRVLGDHTDENGTTVHTGDQFFTAYDTAFFLQEKIAAALTDSGRIDRVVALNGYDSGQGHELVGNHVDDGGVHKIESDPGAGDLWNAHTALQYWRKLVEDELGITLTLQLPTDFDTALQRIETVWDWSNGTSYLQALASILSPSRGYICWLDGTDLHVGSTVDTAIENAAAETLVPANPETVPFSAAVSTLATNPLISQLGTVHYDKVIIRGAPIRVTMTMAKDIETIEEAWDSADETTFDSATAAEIRKTELRNVYRRFQLPTSWGFLDSLSAILIPAATATGGVDWATAQSAYYHDWLLERKTILPDGASWKAEDIQAWVYDGSKYHNIADNTEEVHSSLAVVDDLPGFRLTPKDPATFGLNHYGGSTGDAKWDWEDLFVTVTIATNDHLRYEVSTGGEPGPLEKVKTIQIDQLQLWVIAAGTVLDAYDSTKTTQGANATLRDDSAQLQNLAYVAKAWYGQRRSAIQGGYESGVLLDRLGDLVTTADYGGGQDSVGTVISEIVYQFDGNQRTTWKTDLLEPDFTKWFNPKGSSSFRRRAQGAVNVPAAPGGGGSTVAIVQITGAASPADSQYYLCDVFGNGLVNDSRVAQSATESGVLVHVPGLASGEDLSSTSAYFLAVLKGTHYEAFGAPLEAS